MNWEASTIPPKRLVSGSSQLLSWLPRLRLVVKKMEAGAVIPI